MGGMRDSIGHPPGVVLSGATGFLGGEVLARLLVDRDEPVYVLVRAGDAAAARRRLRDTLTELLGDPEPWSHRAIAVPADLTRDALGLSPHRLDWLADRCAWMVHCAASVSFTLGMDESRSVNVEGTRRMLDLASLAERRGILRCFTHVSTAYVAGTHDGTFAERDIDLGQGHRNPYERTKLEAELAVRERSGSLPVQVMRPSIVVGDSQSGWTPAFNVLYWPLKAFARGSYPMLPASRTSPVDVVPVDYVADALLELGGRPGTTYHLTASDRASTVGELVELAGEHLRRPTPRLLPPNIYRRLLHPVLVRTGDERRRRALRRSEPFFPYFAMGTRYDNSDARAALEPQGIAAPRLTTYFERLIEYAQRADWGRKHAPRHRVVKPPAMHRSAPHREGRVRKPPTREQPVLRR
jgi:thioester reductase-like protein